MTPFADQEADEVKQLQKEADEIVAKELALHLPNNKYDA